LAGTGWLFGAQAGLADMAIAPFVRQFAQTDTDWFESQDWPGLRNWLNTIVSCTLFDSVMHKYPPWQSGAGAVVFNPTVPI
jgi:glutathione S-transferase